MNYFIRHLKKFLFAGFLFAGIGSTLLVARPVESLDIKKVGTYHTLLSDVAHAASSAETVAIHHNLMFVTNARDVSLDIVDIRRPEHPHLIKRVKLAGYGASVNSVDVSHEGLIAVAVEAKVKTDPGTVVFLTMAGETVKAVTVGSQPDMVTFTPDGSRLLVANEGEPDCYGPGCTDPEGSINVIEVSSSAQPRFQVSTIDFKHVSIPADVRIFGPGATPAQDLEPEYITVSKDGKTAWVTLQENNAIAELDLVRLAVTKIFPLGFEDYGLNGKGMDASDADGKIDIQPWKDVRGMYQPDAIAQFQLGKTTYLVTANEGDARKYPGFDEEIHADEAVIDHPLPEAHKKEMLGHLAVTKAPPAHDNSHIYSFGSRSFSIWNASNGKQVWDSGYQFEKILAKNFAQHFNSSNTRDDFDGRSSKKGPEPEGIAVGEINGHEYAFIGLEQVGGVMVYDVSNPASPRFMRYLNSRDFSSDSAQADSGPEVIKFVSAKESPIGKPLLAVANEVSGSVVLWQFAK